ncbi:MAG: class I SAM-dependent methyltransferase [Xanthomonadales bacterium]|nr:class I SAM-dependent methyltransferase [Xanthomonadales bacterium]
MKFETVANLVGQVPFISHGNAKYLYNLIVRERLSNILELGVAHGTATCFMAAALDEIGGGSITCVDLLEAKDAFEPSVEAQLQKTGLAEFATIHRMQTGYTWFLHDEIARNSTNHACRQVYDLCIIDGPKNWTIDGAAFFMVDKLLKHGGWIVFDDYHWTYGAADLRRSSTDGVTHRDLSKTELETPHIREVVELLVRQHPHYGRVVVLGDSDWALAQKTMSEDKQYSFEYRESIRSMLLGALHKIFRRLKGGGR